MRNYNREQKDKGEFGKAGPTHPALRRLIGETRFEGFKWECRG